MLTLLHEFLKRSKTIHRFPSGETDEKMPVLFTGHGSPMNGIEDNEFSQRWRLMGNEIPQPDRGPLYFGSLVYARYFDYCHGSTKNDS